MNSYKLLFVALAISTLVGCRGSDSTDATTPMFPVTPDQDSFAVFLNQSPGVPKDESSIGTVNNLDDFPEAYYNTIDPGDSKTRDTFAKWRQANGFEDANGDATPCDPATCSSTHVKFRDTKDLGYGRNMFMRWDKVTGAVAVYVENFQVDRVPGIPYGPLNLEALVIDDRTWNFGVNAIEFSAYPNTAPGARNFTKFYNFDGEGAIDTSGEQQHKVDLDGRGDKSMPMPCISCHGGAGRTVVYRTIAEELRLAPTITGGIPGDVQAQMLTIEFDTLQFAADVEGFRREDNEDGIRLINEAILSTYKHRESFFAESGDWDASTAISILEGRYFPDISDPNNTYDANFVPSGWSGNQNLYRSLVGPNCMVCHVLRGTNENSTVGFPTLASFQEFSNRTDQLVFEHSKMPAGLLNYSDFWDGENRMPAELAIALNLPDRIVDQRAVRPGAPVAVIAAPFIATGIDSDDAAYDIPITGSGSAFARMTGHEWQVQPASAGIVTNSGMLGDAILRASTPGELTLSLTVQGVNGGTSTTSQIITIQSENDSDALPAAQDLNFYGSNGIYSLLNETETSCVGCHNIDGGFPGIAIHFEPCQSTDIDGYEFLYRSVLARVNFVSPLDSLFLRKPSNGATDSSNPSGSTIPGYHAGGYAINNDRNYNKVLSWILNGAPQGTIPAEAISESSPACSP